MNEQTHKAAPDQKETAELTGRREALLKVGKLAAYAAPFTVLALTNKAEAATGHGPGKHP
jgi:hypothetical protein